jgi:hypothetical protein
MTTEQRLPSKAELLEALQSSGREVIDRVRAMSPDELERGRYENGWNARQILAHIASIEWTYPRLVDLARQGTPAAANEQPRQVRRTEPQEAPGVPTRPMQGGVDSYNERQVAKRAAALVSELLAEFERNRAATITAVEEANEELLRTPIRSAGGITGPLAGVIHTVAVWHVLGHLGDIVRSS